MSRLMASLVGAGAIIAVSAGDLRDAYKSINTLFRDSSRNYHQDVFNLCMYDRRAREMQVTMSHCFCVSDRVTSPQISTIPASATTMDRLMMFRASYDNAHLNCRVK